MATREGSAVAHQVGFAVTCWRCQLEDQLTELMAGTDGVIPAALQPFVDALLGHRSPGSPTYGSDATPRAGAISVVPSPC